MRLKLILSLFFLLGLSSTVRADSVLITNFTQISNRTFADLSSGNLLTPISLGGVLISPNPSLVSGGFSLFAMGSPADPGSGDGYTVCICAGISVSSFTLNFSSPLAAFGVTFHHFFPNQGVGNELPALLQVFDGPNGSGNLLGSIMSVGWLGGANGNADFVAIWSNSVNIRSAVLTGTDPNTRGFAVDGYGVSQTPIPEPATLLLISTGLVGVVAATYKRRVVPHR